MMKVFISADIEGVNGSTNWNETDRAHNDYPVFSEQMTAEVVAACEGALEAGAKEIWVKDAHGSGRNIIASKLPVEVKLVRGWSGHPYSMVDGIDSTFQALMFVGYHSRAGSSANPLAHTMSLADSYVKINGRFASELMMNSYTAALENVPVVFAAGDAGLIEDAVDLIPGLTGVAVKQCLGSSTINIQPQLAVAKIREGAKKALSGDLKQCLLTLPKKFKLEVGYRDHFKAYKNSFYPGASLVDALTIQYSANNYFDVLRFFAYIF
jgi:D-amino peptidase